MLGRVGCALVAVSTSCVVAWCPLELNFSVFLGWCPRLLDTSGVLPQYCSLDQISARCGSGPRRVGEGGGTVLGRGRWSSGLPATCRVCVQLRDDAGAARTRTASNPAHLGRERSRQGRNSRRRTSAPSFPWRRAESPPRKAAKQLALSGQPLILRRGGARLGLTSFSPKIAFRDLDHRQG